MNGIVAAAVYSHHRRGLLRSSRYGTQRNSPPATQRHRQCRQRVGPPFLQCLIREAVVVLADELFVIGERQRDDEGDDREQREVDDDREEPVAPDPLGPGAQSAQTRR